MSTEAVMTCAQQLVKGPISLEAARGNTRSVERTALVVVHHFAGATRLMDIVPLVESDHRIQVVYTVPPASIFAKGAYDFLHQTGALIIPWAQATQNRFDLILTAGQGLLEQLHGPIMTFAHGAGPTSYTGRLEGHGPPASRQKNGLGLRGLTARGRVIPSAIMMAHEDHRGLLVNECPDAAPATIIAGDVCFDRILASRSYRTAYRNALDADPTHKVLVVSSHWGKRSLLGQRADLLSRVAAQLSPSGFRVVAVLHPNIWMWHGRRQVHAWLASAMRHGVIVLPPEEGWRAAVVAGDLMIGDRSSVTRYGAALGLPTLLAPYAPDEIIPDTQFALLSKIAPQLDIEAPLAAQLDATERDWTTTDVLALRRKMTSVPGQAARITRGAIYRVIHLEEPDIELLVQPVPHPRPLESAIR